MDSGPALRASRNDGKHHRPYSRSAPGRPPSLPRGRGLPSPPRKDRGDGAPSGAPGLSVLPRPLAKARAPLGAPSRLFCPRDRIFRMRDGGLFALLIQRASARFRPHRVQPSKAAGRRAGGRLPEASRERGYEPRPQAPHPTPLSERLMTTPSKWWDGNKVYRPRDSVKRQDFVLGAASCLVA
jgi:hypothetical protein